MALQYSELTPDEGGQMNCGCSLTGGRSTVKYIVRHVDATDDAPKAVTQADLINIWTDVIGQVNLNNGNPGDGSIDRQLPLVHPLFPYWTANSINNLVGVGKYTQTNAYTIPLQPANNTFPFYALYESYHIDVEFVPLPYTILNNNQIQKVGQPNGPVQSWTYFDGTTKRFGYATEWWRYTDYEMDAQYNNVILPIGMMTFVDGLKISNIAAAAGKIRIFLSGTGNNTTANMATGQIVTISDVLGTIEANSVWSITVISSTLFDLNASTFTNAYVSGGIVSLGAKTNGIPFQGSIRKFIPDILMKYQWRQVPFRYFTSPRSYLRRFAGLVNQFPWQPTVGIGQSWPAGNALYLGAQARSYTPPVPKAINLNGTGIFSTEKLCNVELQFLLTNRVCTTAPLITDLANQNWIPTGHNLQPSHVTRKFHYVSVGNATVPPGSPPGTTTTNANFRYPFWCSFPFELLFTDPDWTQPVTPTDVPSFDASGFPPWQSSIANST